MKKIFLSIVVLSSVVVINGCKKQLDQQPTGTFGDANAFQSLDDIQKGVNGAYGRVGAYLNDVYVSALVSDEGKIGLDNAGQGALTYRYQYSSDATTGGDVISAYGAYNSLLDQVNRVLAKINEVPLKAGEEARRSVLNGQLLALRAFAHFELLRNYSKRYDESDPLGIPIMLKSDPLALPARNTVKEVMTQVEKDLTDAKGMVGSAFTDTVMNKTNITALQARIALYKRDYTAAIALATEVINANVKPLAGISEFPGIWRDENNRETLIRIRYTNSGAVGGLWNTSSGMIYIAPSDKLADSYDQASDVRFTSYIGKKVADNQVHLRLDKYSGSSRGGNVVDLKVMRIAEMYLIRAEANARKSTPDLVAVADDLNFLRSNRIVGYAGETFANATQAIGAVMDERFKELAFEGFRFYDLKRNNMPVQRAASDANEEWRTLPADSYRFTFPIPRDETNANKNIVQNPGNY